MGIYWCESGVLKYPTIVLLSISPFMSVSVCLMYWGAPYVLNCSKSSSKREVYSNTILPQETRKTSSKQPNFTPKTTGKEEQKTPQN